MEAKRVEQGFLRAKFSDLAKALEEELDKEEFLIMDAKSIFVRLEDTFHRLSRTSEQIMDVLRNEEALDQDKYLVEFNLTEDDRDRMSKCRVLYEVNLDINRKVAKDGDTASSVSTASSPSSKRKFKLPKIELKKFNGDPKEWLGFWGQFCKIDEDSKLDAADKFQYLIQATEKGTSARELIESFPPSADCYPEAIKSLKSRFGREDLLVEVYVRELLKLVLNNAHNNKKKITMSSLHDKLEAQLRALGSLGVTTEKYASMLYPLVESCLPEEVLKAWERNRSQVVTGEDQEKNQLTLLMNFLRREVDSEQRILMARTGFGVDKESGNGKKLKQKLEDTESVPTAVGLLAGSQHMSSKEKKISCVFCDRSHPSHECWKAQKMSLEDKQKCLQQKKACRACLRTGHWEKNCRVKNRCLICTKNHYPVMCPDLKSQSYSKKKDEDDKDDCEKETPSLSNQTCSAEILLPTVMARLTHQGKEKIIRVVIDSGSQRSHICEATAKELGYSVVGEEKVRHILFGGVESLKHHRKYEVQLTSIDKKQCCKFLTLADAEICGRIPTMKNGPWMQEARQKNIKFVDARKGNLDIRMLIGADYAGKLLTGKIYQLPSGPTAMETIFGWTLMGEVQGNQREDSALLVTSLFMKSAAIPDLWRLETIGITDSADVKTREDLQLAAMKLFQETHARLRGSL